MSFIKPLTRPVNSSRASLLDENDKPTENVHVYELNTRTDERSSDHLTSESAEVAYNDNQGVGDSSKSCKWTIGWLTPFFIILGFVLALLVAIGHYIYCLKLDQQPVDSSIPQSWNSAISLAFARVFSVLLAASASQAFTQLLWRYFRNDYLSISKIDALFSLNTGPSKLYRLDLLVHVPVLWTFGLFFALIPIATLFPPGALEVNLLAYPENRPISVPTLDIDDHGNGSAVAFFQNAMFTPGFDGEYRLPADRYTGLARKTLLQGAFLTRPSPCGLDCSYNLKFAAPSLRCADATGMPNLNRSTFPIAYINSPFRNLNDFDPTHYNYMGAPTKSNNTLLGQSTDESFVFVASYRTPDDDSFKYFSCVMMDAIYNSKVTYTSGTQTIDLQVTNEKPLNASSLDVASLFYDLMSSKPGTAPITYPTTTFKQTEEQILYAMHGTQIRSMGDAMLYALAGYISEYGLENQGIGNTMIQEMPLAVPIRNESFYRYVDLRLKLSPKVFEELMRNTTLSIFNDASSTIQTEVAIINYKNAYVFKDPTRLIVSYAATLGVCLVFVTLGLFALWRNGVAADSGIFLQVLCAVANKNSRLTRLAREACLGGSENHTKELLDLKVRFGEVKDDKSLAAFGTADEVTKLKRGRTYG